ncbi:hypothetical protein [Photobacterium lipolyticum]|uniref:Uncharacterized protein n=1 Tax=Photobacterium lipolyticum TaxID=266810 RepID=A0A2T3MPX8_9GAMM|nr:hypothetical protein [Photobacterium lipolyticum]PSV98858.1 hypothetical protein C9I89_22020 [Photobacterium lipolyticum]
MKMVCKLCRSKTELCNSHAIPDSLFRVIFRANSGKAIELNDTIDKPIGYSQDSWATDQLCERCEQKINQSYEQYSLKALRGAYGGFTRLDDGVLFESLDTLKIRQFIAAIMWRASVSDHTSYKAISLPDKLNEKMRFSLNTLSLISKRTLSIRGFKLVDSVDGGFTREHLRECIISPFTRRYLDSNNKLGNTVCFIFLGFLFEVFLSGYPKDSSYHSEFIGFNKQSYKFKYLEITEIPEVFEVMVQAYSKHKEGHTKIKC